MAKSLYDALFDWIVFRINHALLNNRDLEEHKVSHSGFLIDYFSRGGLTFRCLRIISSINVSVCILNDDMAVEFWAS